MGRWSWGWLIALALLVAGCTPEKPPASGERPTQAQPASAPKRVTIGVAGNLWTVSSMLAVGGTGANPPGTGEVHRMLNVGMAVQGANGSRVPRLAETIPSIENGLWQVSPDGRMEVTWKLRRDAFWHDGTPFTGQDLLFTARIEQDVDLPVRRDQKYDFIEAIEARDPYTIVIKWHKPHIEADEFFSTPLPKHVLERPYQSSKEAFLQLPYWTAEFVGTGPFRMKDWAEGSHLVAEAFGGYFLGRPKIDVVEVRFIPSSVTLVANLLAGAVEMTMGRGLSLDQALEIRNQWTGGKVEIALRFGNPVIINPQHMSPDPPVITNAQFRRALYHALDRSEMVNALAYGLSRVAHSGLPADDPGFAAAEARVVRYEYDPRKATQLIEELGYAKGPDGVFRDRGGQPLRLDIRSTETDLYMKVALAASDYWKRIGVAAEPTVIPPARQRDLEYRATFPGFEVVTTGGSYEDWERLTRSELRIAETRWRGRNRPRYVNDELEPLLSRYVSTIPVRERMEILGSIAHHLSDQVVMMWNFFSSDPTCISHRLVNVTGSHFEASETWNAHDWDVRV